MENNKISFYNLDIHSREFLTNIIDLEYVTIGELKEMHDKIYGVNRFNVEQNDLQDFLTYFTDLVLERNDIIYAFGGILPIQKNMVCELMKNSDLRFNFIIELTTKLDFQTFKLGLVGFDFVEYAISKTKPKHAYIFKQADIRFKTKEELGLDYAQNLTYDENVIGTFNYVNSNAIMFTLHKLSDYDRYYYRNVKLELGQQLFKSKSPVIEHADGTKSFDENLVLIDLNEESIHIYQNLTFLPYAKCDSYNTEHGLIFLMVVDSEFTNR